MVIQAMIEPKTPINTMIDQSEFVLVSTARIKPNHTFNECRSASPLDKNVIAKALADKKFDFVKLSERTNALSNRYSAAN